MTTLKDTSIHLTWSC